MEITYDAVKNERNIRERSLSFERAHDFNFATADIRLVVRKGELRLVATGYLDGLLYLMCFLQQPRGIRVISLRRAGRRERREYEQNHPA